MAVFRRQYPDGRVSKDWYIDYRIHGKRYKRRIGPNKKLAEQVLHDIALKLARGDHLGIHEERKVIFRGLREGIPCFCREYQGREHLCWKCAGDATPAMRL